MKSTEIQQKSQTSLLSEYEENENYKRRRREEKRIVEFVEIVEDGYRDLKRLGLESEITTTTSCVSIIDSDAVCNPVVVIFCDASEDAYGSCAYV